MRVVFVSLFCSLFWIQEDEVRQYVRSEMSQHCGESLMQHCPQVELQMVITADESQHQLNSMKVWFKRSCSHAMTLQNWPLFFSLFLLPSCPSVWSSACGGEWAIQLQQREQRGQKACDLAWVTVVYYTTYAAAESADWDIYYIFLTCFSAHS